MVADEAKTKKPERDTPSREDFLEGMRDMQDVITWIKTLQPSERSVHALRTLAGAIKVLEFLGARYDERMENAAKHLDQITELAQKIHRKNEALAHCAEAFGRAVNFALGGEKQDAKAEGDNTSDSRSSAGEFLRNLINKSREAGVPIDIYTYPSREAAQRAARDGGGESGAPEASQPSAAPV